jgi:hypothetical protein
MYAQIVVFQAPKEGYSQGEWEDGAAGGSFSGRRGGEASVARFAVADGATETYEAKVWVRHLLGSFMAADKAGAMCGPALERGSLSTWFKVMQEHWPEVAPAPSDYIEEEKMKQGTLATFVGGQLLGLDTSAPTWQAVALGDSVLFHVRGGRLVEHFPPYRSKDFDTTPDGIGTLPGWLAGMSERMMFRQGQLAPGDSIFAATDAFAKWMITCLEKGDKMLWPVLDDLVHPVVFNQLVAAQRQAMAMKDDDVTLMRIRLLSQPANTVVVCL